MNEERRKRLMDAIENVCSECPYKAVDICESCPVRLIRDGVIPELEYVGKHRKGIEVV